MTQYYVGSKQVQAWEAEKDGEPGYAVRYADGYISWSPKDVFEAAYLPMGEGAWPSQVNARMVDDFIRSTVTTTQGKTTIVHATLANGFELVESASCVDPLNYSQDQGERICRNRITERVWMLLGFLLQTALCGVAKGK